MFKIQNNKYSTIGPDLFYYCQKILIIILANTYILLGNVNSIIAITYSIFPYSDNMIFYNKVELLTQYIS